MHILIIAIGSAGDVHPFVGMAQSFVRQGHRVSICTNPAFAPLVERCGLRLLPLGTAEEFHAAMNDPKLWDPKTSFKVLWKSVAAYIQPLYEILEREVDSETVVVGSLWALGARMMQEKEGIPYVSVQVSPSTFFSAKVPPVHKRFTIPGWFPYPVRRGLMNAIEKYVIDKTCGPDVNRERARLGMPPVRSILGTWLHSPQAVLGIFPEWFAPPQSDWPPQASLTGFVLFDESELHPMDAEVEDFLAAGIPPIVFTPGSTRIDSMRFFTAAADVLHVLGQRGIFIVKDGSPMPALGKDVLVRPYVPLSRLLPHARAIAHHGGIGTIAQALAAGTPQLAMPFAHDQFDNAERMKRLGCGLRLDAPVEYAPLLRSLKRLIEEESFTSRARELKLRVASGEESRRKALAVIEAVGASSFRAKKDMAQVVQV